MTEVEFQAIWDWSTFGLALFWQGPAESDLEILNKHGLTLIVGPLFIGVTW